MLTLLTSSGRLDLLDATLKSFFANQDQKINLIINEDGTDSVTGYHDLMAISSKYSNDKVNVHFLNCRNQHRSIETFIDRIAPNTKYYLHLEDDWHFENSYDWISESIKIMDANPELIKVLCRDGSPHPCEHNLILKKRSMGITGIEDASKFFGILKPWTAPTGTVWHGFSWNPGVTRMDLLRKFIPFPKWEQELAAQIHEAGYRVAELSNPIYKHIGDGRSTHE